MEVGGTTGVEVSGTVGVEVRGRVRVLTRFDLIGHEGQHLRVVAQITVRVRVRVRFRVRIDSMTSEVGQYSTRLLRDYYS